MIFFGQSVHPTGFRLSNRFWEKENIFLKTKFFLYSFKLNLIINFVKSFFFSLKYIPNIFPKLKKKKEIYFFNIFFLGSQTLFLDFKKSFVLVHIYIPRFQKFLKSQDINDNINFLSKVPLKLDPRLNYKKFLFFVTSVQGIKENTELLFIRDYYIYNNLFFFNKFLPTTAFNEKRFFYF